MNKKPNPELIDNDNPEWTAQDIKAAMPFSSLPAPACKYQEHAGSLNVGWVLHGFNLLYQLRFGVVFASSEINSEMRAMADWYTALSSRLSTAITITMRMSS